MMHQDIHIHIMNNASFHAQKINLIQINKINVQSLVEVSLPNSIIHVPKPANLKDTCLKENRSSALKYVQLNNMFKKAL